ncbi:MAG TPA: phytoene/squalene synthase family protein [Verrucomicrobiae bacterium]|jgi:farnesyl-diphosphate farnesyltransferase|nr:phytoene/squalene synthase family protein [Verrucomicrobiae bacterium]
MNPQPELLTDLLKATSRSVYLTLSILPKPVRAQIGLAYLLARATDTIADTEIVSPEQRLAALELLRGRILGEHKRPLDFGELAQCQNLPAERILLERCEEALTVLASFTIEDQKRIRTVLEVITSGQALDLRRFAGASASAITALQNAQELDDYTYRVAGCVGEFWTHICRTHLFPGAKMDEAKLLSDAVRFGKGLQLVNILRDMPADLRQGRCYLPVNELADCGLTPADLLLPASEGKLRPLYNRYLDMAEANLASGWEYTNALPFSGMRVRLGCAWLILIGVKTLATLRTANPLDATQRLKVPRSAVYGVMFWSVVLYPLPFAWRGLFPRPHVGR